MRGDLVNLNFKAINKQCSGLILKCLETRTTHSVPRSNTSAKKKKKQCCMLYLRWREAFVSLVLRCRFTGEGIKPPKGALVKSLCIERLGESIP